MSGTPRAGDLVHVYTGRGATLRRRPYRIEADIHPRVPYACVTSPGGKTVTTIPTSSIIEMKVGT